MAVDLETVRLIVNASAYGLIPIGLLWIIAHYRFLTVALFGLFLHMAVVSVRTALMAVQVAVTVDWPDIHLTTAALSAVCLLVGVVQILRGDI